MRQNPDFMLLKPARISIDVFYKFLANQASHAPSSCVKPAEDDPKPEALWRFYVSEEK